MEVLVYTFRTKDSEIIVCLDPNKDNINKIIESIESNWLNGGCDSQNGNIIIKLFNGDYFGFNPSSFSSRPLLSRSGCILVDADAYRTLRLNGSRPLLSRSGCI